MVGTKADEPDDGTRGIDDDTLASLGQEIDLTVGEEVAHKFPSLHAERLEAVAGLHGAQGEWKTDGGSVEGGDGGVAANARLYPNLLDADFGGFIDAVSTRLWDNERFQRGPDRLYHHAFTVDDKNMCRRDKFPARLAIKTGKYLVYL